MLRKQIKSEISKLLSRQGVESSTILKIMMMMEDYRSACQMENIPTSSDIKKKVTEQLAYVTQMNEKRKSSSVESTPRLTEVQQSAEDHLAQLCGMQDAMSKGTF